MPYFFSAYEKPHTDVILLVSLQAFHSRHQAVVFVDHKTKAYYPNPGIAVYFPDMHKVIEEHNDDTSVLNRLGGGIYDENGVPAGQIRKCVICRLLVYFRAGQVFLQRRFLVLTRAFTSDCVKKLFGRWPVISAEKGSNTHTCIHI